MIKKSFIMMMFLMMSIGIAYGDTIPSLPASYYGKILTEDNQTINGILLAKIDGTERGSIEIVNNIFGGPSYSEDKLIVPGNYDDEGKVVEFYINGTIKLSSSSEIYWHSGEIKEITLFYGGIEIPNNPPNADLTIQ